MMSTSDDVKGFFEKHVIPSLHEWKKSRTDERLAMNLANNLNNLIDYYWAFSSVNDPSKVFNKKTSKAYRAELSKSNSNIGLIRDIADAHKHFKLSRVDRTLTSANQTSPKSIGFGQAYGMSYGGGELLITTLDSKEEIHFSIIVESVYEYWLDLLN